MPRYVSPNEAAEAFALDPKWFYSPHLRTDGLPYRKFGKHLRYDLLELTQWFRSQFYVEASPRRETRQW